MFRRAHCVKVSLIKCKHWKCTHEAIKRLDFFEANLGLVNLWFEANRVNLWFPRREHFLFRILRRKLSNPDCANLKPWTCQCGRWAHIVFPPNNAHRMQVQRLQNAWCKCMCCVYIYRRGHLKCTQASIKNPGLVNMVWRRGVNFLSHSRSQQPIVTKSNLQPYMHQGTIMTCLFTKWLIR